MNTSKLKNVSFERGLNWGKSKLLRAPASPKRTKGLIQRRKRTNTRLKHLSDLFVRERAGAGGGQGRLGLSLKMDRTSTLLILDFGALMLHSFFVLNPTWVLSFLFLFFVYQKSRFPDAGTAAGTARRTPRSLSQRTQGSLLLCFVLSGSMTPGIVGSPL